MNRYWASWRASRDTGPFVLHWPWWISGEGEGYTTIVAAIMADDGADVIQLIYDCYEKPISSLPIRFLVKKPHDWSPFGDRFPRAGWMRWPD